MRKVTPPHSWPDPPPEDASVPPEIVRILREYAENSENGQVILNLDHGEIKSYKTVRYARIIDKAGDGKRQ